MCCNRVSADFDRGCNCNCDCGRDEVGGIRERDCFTIREGNVFCICVKNPRSWR